MGRPRLLPGQLGSVGTKPSKKGGWEAWARFGTASGTVRIERSGSGDPAALVEIRRLGRSLKQRAGDVLAFFERPGTSNRPTEAVNRHLEHLRGSALGFRNLTNYIARSLLDPAASDHDYTLNYDEPQN